MVQNSKFNLNIAKIQSRALESNARKYMQAMRDEVEASMVEVPMVISRLEHRVLSLFTTS